MTDEDLLGRFGQWYEGPEGKEKWIRDSESVKGFLARAFVAGHALRDAGKAAESPPPLPLPQRMAYSPGRRDPEKAASFREAYGFRPAITPPDGDFIQHGTITGRIPSGPPKPQAFPPLPAPVPASDYGWWRPDTAPEADPGHEDPSDG